MTDEPEVLLRIDRIWFNEPKLDWWRDKTYLKLLFQCLEGSGLWLDFSYYRKNYGERFYILPPVEKILEQSTKWKQTEYEFFSEKSDEADYGLALVLVPRSLQVRLLVQGAGFDRYRDVLLDRFVNFMHRLSESLEGKALIAPSVGVEIFNLPYRKVKPPRLMTIGARGNAIDFVSKKYHQQVETGYPEIVKRMLQAPMPAGTSREESDDLIIFRWMDDLTDETHVAECRSVQEQWFATHLGFPIDPSYNKYGDYREIPLSLEDHELVTLYDSTCEAGYKAIVLEPGGGYDEQLFSNMAAWVKEGKLPDGTVLKRLHLVLPNRESVLKILEPAKAIGVSEVLYTDDEGNWWNTEVPGEWVYIPFEES